MSQLRKDMVSGDWIIMAPERAKRPHDFLAKKTDRVPTPIDTCPFEDLEKSGNVPVVASYPNETEWEGAIIPNKFPALFHGPVCAQLFEQGPYSVMEGIGRHELLIGRSHVATLADMELASAVRLFSLLQSHYHTLKQDNCLAYTSTFFNWGPSAGASLFHPHYQILSLPIIPPDVQHSLNGSNKYFSQHQQCVHCAMIAFEKKEGSRIVASNDNAIAFAPYVSRSPFEVRVFPLHHDASFEETPAEKLADVVDLLKTVLTQVRNHAGDPDCNFFIHTAPLHNVDGQYDYYHWHIEVIPKLTTIGGFELGTGIDINVIDPVDAARIMRDGLS